MTVDAVLPLACPRCSSLLNRGASVCRVCQWDGSVTASAPVLDAQRAAATGAAPPSSRTTIGTRKSLASVLTTARAAGVLAWLTCVAAALVLVFTVLAQRQLNATFNDVINNETGQLQRRATTALGLTALVSITALAQLGLALATGILTIVWTVKSRRLVVRRGTYTQRYSESWAIAGWIVPFASLVMPFQIVTDIWHGASPTASGRRLKAPSFVISWWVVLLASGLFALASRPNRSTVSVPLATLSIALECVAAYLFVNMLTNISDRLQIAPPSE